MPLDLSAIYRWASFLAGIPDSEYIKLFEKGLNRNCEHFANETEMMLWHSAPELILQADCKNTRAKLLARKTNLSRDISAFYQTLGKLSGSPIGLSSGHKDSGIAADWMRGYEIERQRYAEELKILSAKGEVKQESLILPASFRGHQAVIFLAKMSNDGAKRQQLKLIKAKSALEQILATSKNAHEREALSAATANLQALENCLDGTKRDLSPLLHLGRLFRKGWIREDCEFSKDE